MPLVKMNNEVSLMDIVVGTAAAVALWYGYTGDVALNANDVVGNHEAIKVVQADVIRLEAKHDSDTSKLTEKIDESYKDLQQELKESRKEAEQARLRDRQEARENNEGVNQKLDKLIERELNGHEH